MRPTPSSFMNFNGVCRAAPGFVRVCKSNQSKGGQSLCSNWFRKVLKVCSSSVVQSTRKCVRKLSIETEGEGGRGRQRCEAGAEEEKNKGGQDLWQGRDLYSRLLGLDINSDLKHNCKYLADPGKARGCSPNTSAIHSYIHCTLGIE